MEERDYNTNILKEDEDKTLRALYDKILVCTENITIKDTKTMVVALKDEFNFSK